jgi:ABC-type multidrug transport system ATPase subunit
MSEVKELEDGIQKTRTDDESVKTSDTTHEEVIMSSKEVGNGASFSSLQEEGRVPMQQQSLTPGERLRPYWSRFGEQFIALCGKQALVYGRNLQATLLRIFSPLVFMFLLWLLDIAFRTDNQNISAFSENTDPTVYPAGGVPSCADDMFINSPCWDFLYSPNTSAVAREIVDNMRKNNPSRPISEDSVIGFRSIDESNEFLRNNIEKVLGGVHFLFDEETANPAAAPIDFVLVSNVTVKLFRDQFQDPTFFFTVPMQVLTEKEIAAYQWRNAGKEGSVDWNVSYSMFAHPTTQSVNIVGQAIGPFIFAANMFNFVLLMSSVVSEKEKGLRQALRTSGMLDSAFWCSWIFIELIISVIFSLLLVGFGAMFQFDFFLKNSFSILLLLFLLFQWAMMGLAFFLAPFIGTTNGAINTGFVVFLVGWIFQAAIAFDFPYTPDFVWSIPIVTVIFTLIPSNPLAKGSIDLGRAAEEGYGISWSRRTEYCQDVDSSLQQTELYNSDPDAYWDFSCVFPLGTIFGVLALEFIVYTLIGIYLDNVLPNENGVRKPVLYLFYPSYWGFGRSKSLHKGLKKPRTCPVDTGADDEDVTAEEDMMKEILGEKESSQQPILMRSSNLAIEVFGLQKMFPKSFFASLGAKMPSCRKKKKKPSKRANDFWAIKGSWFGVRENSIFCLLGPNGAGKTTTINCLTGVLPPSGGDALIHGESIVATGGIDRIRASMGVCPQFDVLWKELTGIEHLKIYGRMKGLRKKEVLRQADDLLESVKLVEAANIKTGAYSGGMRRRLSVAISLLGDPLVVYLDEPTTGMDPISRRHVWDAIEAAKTNRVIVLTTHSMEEADILGDSIAIMARGKLRAIGSSIRLKQKFGSGYQISLSFEKSKFDTLEEFMAETFLVKAPEEIKGTYAVYTIPKSFESRLPSALKALEESKVSLGVSDVQIQMTSLEEVFLNIAKKAEIEASLAEGGVSEEEIRLEDGSILRVPIGQDYAVHDETHVTYSIQWAQDEMGRLQVQSWEPVTETEAEQSP